MSSIWDAPQAPNAALTLDRPVGRVARSVSTIDPRTALTGTAAGPLLTAAGRGVVNGVPLGENAEDQAAAMNQQYMFRPAWRDRLVAATRSALGR